MNERKESLKIKSLGRSQGNISRELGRNTGQRGYRHKQANDLTQNRHKTKVKKVKLTSEIKLMIDGYLEKDWSPEQIAGTLELDAGSRYFCESLFWASQPKQAAKT